MFRLIHLDDKMSCQAPEFGGIGNLDCLRTILLAGDLLAAGRHVAPDLHFLRVRRNGAERALVGCHEI